MYILNPQLYLSEVYRSGSCSLLGIWPLNWSVMVALTSPYKLTNYVQIVYIFEQDIHNSF